MKVMSFILVLLFSAAILIAGELTSDRLEDPLLPVPATGCDYVIGDVNGSDSYNGLDITFGVNYFRGGPDPFCPLGSCPIPPCDAFYYCGDVNGGCSYNGLDITYGVNYFRGGPGPVPCGSCPPVGGTSMR
jgi:hypothetical protein